MFESPGAYSEPLFVFFYEESSQQIFGVRDCLSDGEEPGFDTVVARGDHGRKLPFP